MKIAIFLPSTNNFYSNISTALKCEFESLGLEVISTTSIFDPSALIKFCNEYKPDYIFEMNRSRNEIPELPKNIIHISWIVDLQGRNINDIQESEIIYFFGTSWKDYHVNKNSSLVDWLPPGFCPKTYNLSKQKKICDFSFAGHIPSPWTEHELSRSIYTNNTTSFSFDQLFNQCKNAWEKHGGLHQLTPGQYLDLVNEVINNNTHPQFKIKDRTIKYDIETRSTRMINRQHLIDTALSLSSSLSIYGTPTWQEWERYKPYYHKSLTSQRDICGIYQTSKLNLHEGIGIHFRTLDCMGAGGALAFKSTSRDNYPDGINSFFEPFKHYLPLDIEGNSEHLNDYLNNEKKIQQIATNASELTHRKHTWAIRCKKILSDIASL